jgi:threonyl-tRNA synthetase
MRNAIETFWKDVHINGPKPYELLYTPHMASLDLWKTSGHFDFYKDGMFDQVSVPSAAARGAACGPPFWPPNCPANCPPCWPAVLAAVQAPSICPRARRPPPLF